MPTRDEPIIQADRNRLWEVLDNLLENAIKYSPEGGAIEVVILPVVASSRAGRSRKVPGNSDHDKKMGIHPSVPRSRHMVEICVRDNGIGIPAAHLERIFDRFHRVDTRLTREVNGIGLGLAICKRIELTPLEYGLLACLAQNTGRVLTQDLLLKHVWGTEYSGESHILQVNINRLRSKLEHDPANPRYILTKVGIGYLLAAQPEVQVAR